MPHHQRGDSTHSDPSNCRLVTDRGCNGTVSPIENGVCSNVLQLLTWGTAVGFCPPFLVPPMKVMLGSPHMELRKQKGPVSSQPSGWTAQSIVTLPQSIARRSDQGVRVP